MIIEYSQLYNIRKQNSDKTLVLSGGSFDLIHFGHLQYLQKAMEYGQIVMVAIKGDEQIAREKGANRPIIPQADRLRMVDAIKGVDYCFIVPPGVGFAEVAIKIQPDLIVTANPEWQHYESLKPMLITEPRFTGGHYRSTTAIIQHIAANEN